MVEQNREMKTVIQIWMSVFISVGLFVFFSSGKKQANKQTKKTTVYIPKGGGSIRLGASEAGI